MYQKVILDNGAKILTEEVPYVRSVAIGIFVDVGSRDELKENNGISHFIEHLMFKGTKRRTAKQIAETLDAVGGQLNAFTTKEYTCYYAKVIDEHLGLAIDLLTDMVFNSNFAAADIDRERNVILEEIKMYEDAPDEQVHDVFVRSLWQDHVLGRPIIGDADIIQNMTSDQIMDFYKKYYVPGNLVISVVGNIKHDQVVNALNGLMAGLTGERPDKVLSLPKPFQEIICREKDTEQVHLCFGTQGLKLTHDDIYIMQVLNTVLGGGISSRLFQEVREQRGLVYSIYSYHSSYHDSGIFCIYAGLSKLNVEQVLELVVKELRDIQKSGLTEDELRRTKDQLKGNLLLSLESINVRMSRLGKSEFYLGRLTTPEEIVEKVNLVTNEDIQRIARDILEPKNFSLATIGPWQEAGYLRTLFDKSDNL
ncbi:peptidase M16 domain protein [Desulfofarcimen acetoxidans DSM 771]|jgi:predicted Zn-dependent peptidase|uniref:Peptidase M16 domain protein n=1 Tax=Desulfofarcimen acetoxidans (strain ATCC 49208 / DSM 771 / KCTC 5769 / VKM B-1644 / 5575) TaxID=485916 RepID=C8W4N3_DESAS|nr:pitrilysin family protein [Desulfofarcimen acetoxidans]ACV63919.1 peptidase M16 domain protein [Desulfofarcimen acetoxidans DSM 771]